MEEQEIMEQEQIDETTKYINAIQEIKRNSVSKEEADRLRAENEKLVNALAQGKTIENTSSEGTKPDIRELRKKVMDSQSNLDYWKNTLELRDAVIDQTGVDPFLPYGKKISPTEEDVQKAERVAKVVRECIDYADGDSAIFTNELQRRTNDVAPVRMRK